MAKYVVDVSRWNGKMSWSRAANAGCVLGVARATMGLPSANYTGVDEEFANNWAGMEGEGIGRGAYHLFLPELDGKAQGEWFVSVVQDRPKVAVLDGELNKKGVSKSVYWDRALAWCVAVDSAWPGVTIKVYTRKSFWDVIAGVAPWPMGGVWVAHYTNGPKPLVPKSWATWDLWQFSADGNKRGGEFGAESCDIDLSRANFRL